MKGFSTGPHQPHHCLANEYGATGRGRDGAYCDAVFIRKAADGFDDLTCHYFTKQLTDNVTMDGSTFSLPVTGCTCADADSTDVDGLRTCNGVTFDGTTGEVTSCGDGTEFAFSDEIKLNKKCLAELLD